MYRANFVGRSRELEVLDNLWDSSRATLLILYGRRRVGKTRLLTHWLQQQPHSGLYWVAEPASALTQLRSFTHALMAYVDPEAEIPPDFTYTTWEQAFRQLAFHAQERRIALFIDEVTYLIDVNPDLVGILQKAWDRWLSNSNLMLALSGSQMGQIYRHLIDYEAPLYGRATAQMMLPPLPYGATKDYFPGYSPAERVSMYAMWGGVPAYWERVNLQRGVMDNLRQNILPAYAWMIDESRILLQDFITDLHNYVGLMRAVADGHQALGDIAKRAGMSSSKASFYLSVLRDTGFVERRVPISQRGTDSRRGRYFLTDPYLRFFYRFLSAYQSKLALGQVQSVLELIERELPSFIAANTWQELCRDWLLMSSATGDLGLRIDEVGSEWTRSTTIDVVGINDVDNTLVLGDCYWEDAQGPTAIEELVQKTATLLPKDDEPWNVYFVLFSAQGWSADAEKQAHRILENRASRSRRWQSLGIRLLDLKQVDDDLATWSV
ncbi:MAG: ATP-binding protein [Anaerolineae bacterium]|nr:ATP-binding protein [Anaerolineae bacterium]MCO5188944.1 ATP-binding protein [Anaerolineae bacterium]MCO5195838.1 ATP-binding protein [Anaerolineae bacterium]